MQLLDLLQRLLDCLQVFGPTIGGNPSPHGGMGQQTLQHLEVIQQKPVNTSAVEHDVAVDAHRALRSSGRWG
ncbi:hypothetical protein [Pseudomonas sp. PSKL.D1]|uniref:hypothetical protein n=1 Tax=Pseudomonas sp. PSKL.D1 TaxID=3029060 RepID=UPI0023817F04|nr:hypothetical protein [Pseudomonas sp. PSKL.D1]WDY57891.1 hypothetical protein PVV54_25560 [Pseudomonas sp. PSKL.D1]